jgi:hypothetical protein
MRNSPTKVLTLGENMATKKKAIELKRLSYQTAVKSGSAVVKTSAIAQYAKRRDEAKAELTAKQGAAPSQLKAVQSRNASANWGLRNMTARPDIPYAEAKADAEAARKERIRGHGHRPTLTRVHGERALAASANAAEARSAGDKKSAAKFAKSSLEHRASAQKAHKALLSGKRGGKFYLNEGKRIYVKK